MRRAFFLFALSSFASAAVCSAAWEGEFAPQLETGFVTRAHLRGVEQAREGAFATTRLAGESFRADASWHQSFRRSDERVGALGFGYDVWKSAAADSALEMFATHRRFAQSPRAAAVGGSRGVAHSTELGARFSAAPIRAFVSSLSYTRDLRRGADIVETRLAREFALTRWGAFLNTSVFAGYVDADDVSPDRIGPPARDAYAYFGADARLPYRIGERTMLVLTAHVSAAHGASGAWSTFSRASQTRAGLGLSVTFDF